MTFCLNKINPNWQLAALLKYAL